jgi:uncharacterized protein (UPF0261 family)
MPVYLIATLDTKGREIAFVRDRLRDCGVQARVVDCGCLGEPTPPPEGVRPHVTREQVFVCAGTTLADMQAKADRGEAVTRAAEGVAGLIRDLYGQGQVDGVLAIGGSAGTTIGTAAMRALPLGVPKVMLSTLTSGAGGVRRYVGDKDIVMINSVVDIAGLNRISRTVLAEAAAAMAGMVKFRLNEGAGGERPLIAATMFGVTTPCVQRAREVLEQAGYEVLVFHATGSGGQAMESLIREGVIAGVLDITTTELADEIVGGLLTAGPDRLTAAADMGVPNVVSVGATDMVNFAGMETVPDRFRGRRLYKHNPTTTLMRTTAEECAKIGADLATKVARSKGPAVIMLPLRGVSAIDREGQPFDDPAARAALFDAVRQHHGNTKVIELDSHINDPVFAEAAARHLVKLMRVNAT